MGKSAALREAKAVPDELSLGRCSTSPAQPGMGHLLGQRDLISNLAKRADKEKREAKNKGYRDTDLDNCPGLKDMSAKEGGNLPCNC